MELSTKGNNSDGIKKLYDLFHTSGKHEAA